MSPDCLCWRLQQQYRRKGGARPAKSRWSRSTVGSSAKTRNPLNTNGIMIDRKLYNSRCKQTVEMLPKKPTDIFCKVVKTSLSSAEVANSGSCVCNISSTPFATSSSVCRRCAESSAGSALHEAEEGHVRNPCDGVGTAVARDAR
mmetsp:Transcript_107296/g.298372  ORF Transcript_107296/g.298372 Transcript_107296/m.298372 type:complete len:145 (-) Transcript_107296:32-466(-)